MSRAIQKGRDFTADFENLVCLSGPIHCRRRGLECRQVPDSGSGMGRDLDQIEG